jgi:twinkle protein
MRDVNLQGSAGRLQKRRISEKTCELFKAYKDGEQLRFHYYNSAGSLLGAKIKTKDKDFR